MSAAAPLANQTGAGLQAEARRGVDLSICPQGFGHRLEFAARRLAEPAVRDFLKPVAYSKDQEGTTYPRWIALEQATPFKTHLLKSERSNAIELALDRRFIRSRHG
jgi:hypothetical protein